LKAGVPKEVSYFLENINRSNPILPKEEKLDETTVKIQKRSQEIGRTGQ